MKKIIIIGGGAAGCEAALAARKQSADAQITVFAAERYLPYRRPVLPGVINADPPASFWLKKEESYKENSIEFKLDTPVAAVDTAGRTVTDFAGNVYPYDRLCFAAGAKARIPQIPGVELEGVFGCRSFDDFKEISASMTPGCRAVVIGGGVLGLEVACAMIKAQAHVTVLEHSPRLLPRQLSSKASPVLERVIRDSAGDAVDIICGASAAAIEGKEGKVCSVLLADGRKFPCSAVIAAMGVIPETELAAKAGLKTGARGIIIDDSCRCAGYDDVFACGDCAVLEDFNPGLFPVAQTQGQTAGCNMAGGDIRCQRVDPPVRLPAFGVKMLSLGKINEADAVELVPEGGMSFRGIYFENGLCCGAVLIGDMTGQSGIAALVNSKTEKAAALHEGGFA